MKSRSFAPAAMAIIVTSLVLLTGCDSMKWKQKGIQLHSTYILNQRRILAYAVSVSDETTFEEMQEYAASRQWRERGLTVVMFFDAPENTPDISEVGWEWHRGKYGEHEVACWFRDKHKKDFWREGPVNRNFVLWKAYMAGEDV